MVEAEHILVYSKTAGWQPGKLPRTAEMDKKYKNPDNDVGLLRSDNPYAPGAATHQGMVYAIQHPFTAHKGNQSYGNEESSSQTSPEEREKMTHFKVHPSFTDALELRLPQFFLKASAQGLFSQEEE